jgi:valyl-tRNA synthetase
MNAQNIPVNNKLLDKHIDFADEWITSHFHLTLVLLNTAMDNFEVNNATKILYSFVWNDFCDWYLEMIKTRFYSDDDEVKSATLTRALKLFAEMLKLVHPFMPFITEELWQLTEDRKDGESISTSEYPKLNSDLIKPSAESEMEMVQGIVYSIRNIRGEMNIPPSKSIDAYIKSSEVKEHQIDYIKKLAKVENIIAGEDVKKPGASASAVFSKSEIYIPLKGLIDLDVERQRIAKEINRLEGSLKGIEKKLSNEKFVNNAPADVVEKEKTKQRDWTGKLDKLKELLSNLN